MLSFVRLVRMELKTISIVQDAGEKGALDLDSICIPNVKYDISLLR